MPTIKVSPAPVVLVIGCPPGLGQRCREAAIMGHALVVECEVRSARTLASQTWPLLLVVLQETYAPDASVLDALADEVQADLVVLPSSDIPQPKLEQIIVDAITRAQEAPVGADRKDPA
jgi:hypothetical protein